MNPPRSACGAGHALAELGRFARRSGLRRQTLTSTLTPPGGLSPDTEGPVGLPCLAKGRAFVPGAACKARQRTGGAGSAVSAWLVWAALMPSAYADGGRTPRPVIEPAKAGTQCVEPADVMRRNHMRLLEAPARRHGARRRSRREVQPEGLHRLPCQPKTASVAKAETNFCVSCHSYAAVRIDCFECHTSKSRKVAQGATK